MSVPAAENAERRKREIKAEYRREVWTGSGQPLPLLDYRSIVVEPEKDFPAPLSTSDQPLPCDPPAPVAALGKLARVLGWKVHITYAHGYMPHASHGRPSAEPKESWAVRLSLGARHAVAVRMGGSWSSFWVWSPTQFFTRHETLTAFEQAILP